MFYHNVTSIGHLLDLIGLQTRECAPAGRRGRASRPAGKRRHGFAATLEAIEPETSVAILNAGSLSVIE
jgi:hypothetical protein